MSDDVGHAECPGPQRVIAASFAVVEGEQFRLTTNEATLKASSALHALGRIGEPSDVAVAIEWLLSPEQGWVTGQVLGIDGGLGSLRSR